MAENRGRAGFKYPNKTNENLILIRRGGRGKGRGQAAGAGGGGEAREGSGSKQVSTTGTII